MNLEDCLPPRLRGPGTTITAITSGLSGAGVYRIDAGERAFVLKIADARESEAEWRQAVQVQRLAAEGGLAPAVVHVDEERRAVLSDFVADRSFVAFYREPATHGAAVELLGRTVRRIHGLPRSPELRGREPREFLVQLREAIRVGFAIPEFAREAIERALSQAPPAGEGATVLSHNDLNPGNLVYDGQAIMVLDWAAAGPNDDLYDLATLAVFVRMDEGTCLRLLSAYQGETCTALPPRFLPTRRLVAALAGTAALHLARLVKHPGATGAETLDATLALGDFYQQMRTGALPLGTPAGQWAFGLALLKESLAV
jgi:aminoglycoside phosphotransferase (APT) family kinase protein